MLSNISSITNISLCSISKSFLRIGLTNFSPLSNVSKHSIYFSPLYNSIITNKTLNSASFSSSSKTTTLTETPSEIEGCKTYTDKSLILHSKEDVFSVISDVNRYKEFLPWCKESRIISVSDDGRFAQGELVIGFGPVKERYTSNIIIEKGKSIHVEVTEGALLQYLSTHWSFTNGPQSSTTWLSFQTSFLFRSAVHTRLVDLFFREVVSTLKSAFIVRCDEIYDPANNPSLSSKGKTTRRMIRRRLKF